MMVRVLDIAQDGTETERVAFCPLAECFPGPENAEDLAHVAGELTRSRRCWVGGGAAPMTLLMLVSP